MSDKDIVEEAQIDAAMHDYESGQDADAAKHVPALCQTVRALRAKLAQCEGSRRIHELDNHHNALACGYCAGPLKARLAQVEQERNALRDDVERLARAAQEKLT